MTEKTALVTGRAPQLIGDNVLSTAQGKEFCDISGEKRQNNLLQNNEGHSKTREIVKRQTQRITPVSHYMSEI